MAEALETVVKQQSAQQVCAVASGRIITADGSFLRRQRRRVAAKVDYVALLQRNYLVSSLQGVYAVRRGLGSAKISIEPTRENSHDPFS